MSPTQIHDHGPNQPKTPLASGTSQSQRPPSRRRRVTIDPEPTKRATSNPHQGELRGTQAHRNQLHPPRISPPHKTRCYLRPPQTTNQTQFSGCRSSRSARICVHPCNQRIPQRPTSPRRPARETPPSRCLAATKPGLGPWSTNNSLGINRLRSCGSHPHTGAEREKHPFSCLRMSHAPTRLHPEHPSLRVPKYPTVFRAAQEYHQPNPIPTVPSRWRAPPGGPRRPPGRRHNSPNFHPKPIPPPCGCALRASFGLGRRQTQNPRTNRIHP